MVEINITYETLYEILRNEKNRDDLQELNVGFYEDVVKYLNKNKEMLSKAHSDDETEDLARQIKNIKAIIKEIYERREKKIINMAINKSRAGSESVEIDYLLPQEKDFYIHCVALLDRFRTQDLSKILDGSIILPTRNFEPEAAAPKQEAASEAQRPATAAPTQEHAPHKPSDEKKTIKFRENVPKFLGKQLEVYGPFEPEEVVTLPSDLADILIRKGKADQVFGSAA